MLVFLQGMMGATLALIIYSFVTEYTLEQRVADHQKCLKTARELSAYSEFMLEASVAEKRIVSRRVMLWGHVRVGDVVEPASIRCTLHDDKLDLFYSAAGVVNVTVD